ncbi:MAG TPA: AMP-binding protein [Bacillales bacterium]|nr:AMP-binding protein [Bacillales bacterium]
MTTITDTYKKYSLHFPDKTAIQTQNKRLSYFQWHEQICKTATWLHSLEFANKTLGILLPNGIPFLQLFTGASMAGWTAVPFDLKWNQTELQKRIAVSLPSILITTKMMSEQLKKVHPNVLIYEECCQEVNQTSFRENFNADGKLPFYMGFTSGSTGEPKAFIRSHESWVESFACNQFDFHIDQTDHVLIPGALIHSHFLYGAISTLYMGGTVYLLEKFSPNQALTLIETNPISTIYVVPTMIEAFLKDGRMIEKSLKILSSGAKWSEKSKQEIQKMFVNLMMFEFYGASELSFVTVQSDQENKHKSSSVGKPCHGVEIKIRQANNELAKPYEIGKIYVQSKMIFSGYLDAGTQSIQSFQDADGWMTVGDMGYLDEDGFLYIEGREKNMILFGGINIFPEEIEKIISLHPDVEEVAVIGLADPYWGQIVAAVIKGKTQTMDLKKLCKKYLSSFKIPRKWYFVDEIPHTTSGKISRPKTKELIERKVMNH